jgi:hypothetical protein
MPHDFAAADIGGLKEKVQELEESQKGMKKKANPKAINMIDRCASSCCCKVLTNGGFQRQENGIGADCAGSLIVSWPSNSNLPQYTYILDEINTALNLSQCNTSASSSTPTSRAPNLTQRGLAHKCEYLVWCTLPGWHVLLEFPRLGYSCFHRDAETDLFFWSGTTSLVCFGCRFSAPNGNTLIVSP